MIVSNIVTINGRDYTRTCSDAGMTIRCETDTNNAVYEEAIDLPDSERMYVETEIPLESVQEDHETMREALQILGVYPDE